jgi:hypothetical protein
MGCIGLGPEGEYILRDMIKRSRETQRTVADLRSKYCMSYVRFRWRMQLDSGVC